MKAILTLIIALLVSGSVMAVPPVGGGPLPIDSVSVPSNDDDGEYTVVIVATPDQNPESFFKVQEQKDGDGYSPLAATIYTSGGSATVPLDSRYTALYSYRAKRCIASNCTNWVYSNTVSVIRTPDKPAQPSSNAQSTNGAVSITWSKPDGVVSHYDLQKQLSSGSWTTAATGLTGLSKSISGLGDGNWRFRVRACDAYSGTCSHYSSTSGISYVRHKPSTPAAPSSGAQSINGGLTVTWNKPSGAVTYYDLQKQLNGGAWTNESMGDTDSSESLSGLADGNWTFKVRACNEFSWACSSYSTASGINYVRRKPSTPAAPSSGARSTDGSMTVTWSKPGGTVTHYDLQKRLNTGSWTDEAIGTAGTSDIPTGLNDGNWTFKVRACNDFSWACSSYSAAGGVNYVRRLPTTPAAPGVPGQTLNQSVSIDFGSAAGSGTYYKLLSRKGGSGGFNEHNTDAQITAAITTAAGLTDGYWHFQVSHCNGFDWACATSATSHSVNARQRPQSVSLSMPGTSKPRREYQAGFYADSPVTQWILEERKTGASTWNTAYQGSVDSKTLTKTQPDETWEYQLTACNTAISCATTGTKTIDITPLVIGDIYDAVLVEPLIPEHNPTVGQLNPEVGVNGGAVNLSLPIVVPPGRAGVEPKLTLKYTSIGSNGPLGLGGSLVAGGAIRRCADIYELDKHSGSVTDDAEDKLCLNGERLVLADTSSTYGASASIYYPETQPQLKVIQSGALASASFTLHHSDGTVDYYGDTSNSHVLRNGVRVAWKLRKSQDFHNNSIIYAYTAFEGGSRLTDIYYTGSGDSKGNRQVKLIYESRDDIQISYRSGSRKLMDKRLKRVSTYAGGNPVRDYHISYNSDTTLSKIKSITLCGWNTAGTADECFPATVFEWDNWQPGFAGTPVKTKTLDDDSYRNFGGAISASLDYDGDGQSDIVLGREGLAGDVILSSSATMIPLPYKTQSLSLPNTQSYSVNNYGTDLNSDGRVDNLGYTGNTLVYGRWDGGQFVRESTGINFQCIETPWDTLPVNAGADQYRACSHYTLDFDGDGRQDLVVTHQTSAQSVALDFYRANGDGTFTNLHRSGSLSIDSPLTVTDFDGDGDPDLVGISIDLDGRKRIVTLTTQWSGSNLSTHIVILPWEDMPLIDADHTPLFLDANQDGLLDLLVYRVDGWKLHINTGGDFLSLVYDAGFTDSLLQDDLRFPNSRYLQGYIRTLDYNRDGITDLLVPDTEPAEEMSDCGGYCATWDQGQSFADRMDLYQWNLRLGAYDEAGHITYDTVQPLSGLLVPLTDLNLLDYDGDGYTDIVTRYGTKYYNSQGELMIQMQGPYASQPGVYVYYNQIRGSDQISTVTTGLHIEHEFDYTMLHSDDDFYTVTSTRQTFPCINGSTHSHAVKEYRTSDGLGGLSKTTFSYKDALFHLQGRGHQGFREIIERKYASASDSQPYAEVITEFAQTFPQSGSVVHQETRMRNVSGNLVKTASVDNQLSVIGGQLAPTQFAYANRFTTKKYELDGSLISTEAVTRTYNYLGLLTGATSVISDTAGEVARTTTKTNNFTLDTDNWWFRLEDSAERHRISHGDPLQLPADTLTDVTVTKTYEYTDSGTRQPSRVTTSSSDTSLNLVTTNRYTGPYKQLDRVTLTSNGSGNTAVEGSRWTEMDYSTGSDNGYFVTKTYNSAWGLSVAANSASYDPRTGLPFTQTDANGNTTSNQYDHFGHLIESDAPGVPTQKLFRQWCSAGCPSAATSRKAVYFEIAAQAGAPQVFTYYDARGREVYRETEGTDGTIVQWQSYDNRGRITQVVDPHYTSAAVNDYGMVDFTAFDGLSRPIGKTVTRLPISYSVDYAYSGLTTEITVTPHGLGEVLMMASRSTVLGQPMYHQDARDQFTRFRYDALGNVAMIQDVSGNAITARYNGLGHKIALNDPNMGQWQFAYNALGELRWQRDAKGQVSIFNYDSLGRLVHQYPGSDAAQHFEFDINHYGTLDREYTGPSANPNVERIYTYDTLQRETARITQIDGHVFTRKTVWDGNYGRIKGLQYPDGTFVETLYDQMGRIAEEWDYIEGVKLRTVESRSATEAITRQSLANALIEESQYNAAGLLDQRCVSNLLGDCSTSNLIYDQYDSYGNLKHRSNSIAGVEESFTYDNLHRLTQSTRSWEIHIPATLHSTVDYDYDTAGNLLYKSDFSDRGNAYQYGDSTRSTNNAGPNAVTRVTLKDLRTRTFQYDLNGNLTADGIRSISYGVTNKPKSITHSNGNSAQFHYGPDGSRYKQVVTDGSATTTRYYLGAYEYEETEKGGSTTVVERTTVGNYAQYRIETINGAVQSNGWEFLHRDHLGSIESITDISGEVRERRGFDPFGKVRDLNEDDGNGGLLQRATTKRGFTGHEHLDGVELIHANGRAYDYNLGRFLSVDPFISMPENSQAYNPYSYVMNNPLRYTDPTGYVVQQNCSPACDVDDIETKSQKRAQKERIEKRINNLLKEAILLGNGSATKVGEDDSSSSGANVENSGAGNSITGFLKGIGQAFLDDQAQALADGIGIQDTDSVQSSIQLPISDSELGGVGLAQSAVDNVGMLSAAVMMVANLRNGDATPSREMIMGSFSLLVKDGAIDASLLSTFLPSNLRNSFRPTDRVPAGQKYMFKIGDTKINIKWHSRDLGLKETIPRSNSARVWTAQIQVGRKFLMTNGQWTRKQKSNRTHIPIIR